MLDQSIHILLLSFKFENKIIGCTVCPTLERSQNSRVHKDCSYANVVLDVVHWSFESVTPERNGTKLAHMKNCWSDLTMYQLNMPLIRFRVLRTRRTAWLFLGSAEVYRVPRARFFMNHCQWQVILSYSDSKWHPHHCYSAPHAPARVNDVSAPHAPGLPDWL